jgi:ATP-dependent helicase/nuclease subunit B
LSCSDKSSTHLSATSHEQLLVAGGEFLLEHKDSAGIVIVSRHKLAADQLVYRNSHLGLRGIHRLTIEQLAHELSRRHLAEAGHTTASPLALDAVTRRSVDAIAQAGGLRYFGSVAAAPRFSGAVLRTLRELRLEGVEESQLSKSGPAASDLGMFLSRYARELTSYQLTDLSHRLGAAIDTVRYRKHHLCGLPLILLCPDVDNEAQRQLLKALVERSPAVLALSLHHLHARLEEIVGIAATPLRRPISTCLEYAQEKLFSVHGSTARPRDEAFDIFSASGEALECVEIVRRIGEFVEAGIVFDQIAILLRSQDRYQAVLDEALQRSKIPVWFSHGCKRPLPSGRAFLALLECARENFTATRFLEYMSLGQAPRRSSADAREGTRIAAPALFERLIVDAAVIGGKDRWRDRLNGLLESLSAKYSAADEESERETFRNRIEALSSLIDFALPLIELLEELPSQATWGDWLYHLHVLADNSLNNADAVNEALDELEPLRNIESVTLDDVLTLLSDRLRSLRQPQSGARRYGSVFVGTTGEATGMTFEVVFIPGLSEGMFPRPITEDPLLLNNARREISERLRIISDEDERRLLRTVLAAAGKTCVCSYPRMDLLTGRARVPSLYFFEVARAAYGEIGDIRQMESDARTGVETSAGWPAPKKEMDAIDPAEFDLATLRPVLRQSHATGLGAYLTRVEGPLANALRSRWLRWNEEEWKWPDGIVDIDIDAQVLIDQYSPRLRAYSPSALQEFALCPYRFALRVIHGLRPAERPVMLQRIDPMVRGSFFHRAAYETIRQLVNAALLPLTVENQQVAFEILDDAVERTSAEYASNYSPAIPAIWKSEVAMIKADLRGWLQNMMADPSWQPVSAELSFGRPLDDAHDPQSVPTAVRILDEFAVIGSIDLIERNSQGDHRVTDYKTGRVPYPQPQAVGGGAYLQPLIYALAAQAMLGQSIAGGRLHYATMRGTYKSIFVSLNEYNKRALAKVLDGIDISIRNGFLPAAPKEGACLHCDFAPICGPYEEDRIKKKSRVELKGLTQIRAMK